MPSSVEHAKEMLGCVDEIKKLSCWNEVKLTVLNRAKDVERRFFKEGIHKWVSRYEECIERIGDYVKKQLTRKITL